MAEDTVIGSFNIFDNSVAVIKNSSSALDYLFRYRLVTDEGEALSQWSGVNTVTQDSVSTILDGFTSSISVSSVESGGAGINVKWTIPDNFPTNKFDIYFSWSYENAGTNYTDFEYADTVTSNSYYIDIPVNGSSVRAKRVKIILQVPTNIKILNTNARIFESLGYSTLPILDAGTI